MKQRVSLTIDPEVMRRARHVARQRHTSVSQLVEDCLARLVRSSGTASEDFVEKWAGKLKLAPRDPGDPRREYLWQKHELADHADTD